MASGPSQPPNTFDVCSSIGCDIFLEDVTTIITPIYQINVIVCSAVAHKLVPAVIFKTKLNLTADVSTTVNFRTIFLIFFFTAVSLSLRRFYDTLNMLWVTFDSTLAVDDKCKTIIFFTFFQSHTFFRPVKLVRLRQPLVEIPTLSIGNI